jgi:hypothetical protein
MEIPTVSNAEATVPLLSPMDEALNNLADDVSASAKKPKKDRFAAADAAIKKVKETGIITNEDLGDVPISTVPSASKVEDVDTQNQRIRENNADRRTEETHKAGLKALEGTDKQKSSTASLGASGAPGSPTNMASMGTVSKPDGQFTEINRLRMQADLQRTNRREAIADTAAARNAEADRNARRTEMLRSNQIQNELGNQQVAYGNGIGNALQQEKLRSIQKANSERNRTGGNGKLPSYADIQASQQQQRQESRDDEMNRLVAGLLGRGAS